MTYPGTTRRAQTALESSLVSRVTELERERDELVEGMQRMTRWMQSEVMDAVRDSGVHASDNSVIAVVRKFLAKYPT